MSQPEIPHAPSIEIFSGRYGNKSQHEQPTNGGVIEDDPEFNSENYIGDLSTSSSCETISCMS
ncbi:hypothetical protein FA13DRAFT_1740390, partial [Coprinellus micaceus]